MEYISIAEAAARWGISPRRVQVLCTGGRIPGVTRFSNAWAIPCAAEKPSDARIKSGRYVGRPPRVKANGPARPAPSARSEME